MGLNEGFCFFRTCDVALEIEDEVENWKDVTANYSTRLSEDIEAGLREQMRHIFKEFIKIKKVHDVIQDENSWHEDKRKDLRKTSLYGKPAFLHCLFQAWVDVRSDEGMTDEVIREKIEKMDFDFTNDLWQNVLFLGQESPPKMMTKPEDKKIMTYLIKHLLGHDFHGLDRDINWGIRNFEKRKRDINSDATLPDPI